VVEVPIQKLVVVVAGEIAGGVAVTSKLSIFRVQVLNTVSDTQYIPPDVTVSVGVVAPVLQK
jgi:hypothetical protein